MHLLNDGEIKKKLQNLNGWSRVGNTLCKKFTLKTFAGAMDFVNKIAAVAEEANHHPDIDIHNNVVLISLSTHSVGGISPKDLELAFQIDRTSPDLP